MNKNLAKLLLGAKIIPVILGSYLITDKVIKSALCKQEKFNTALTVIMKNFDQSNRKIIARMLKKEGIDKTLEVLFSDSAKRYNICIEIERALEKEKTEEDISMDIVPDDNFTNNVEEEMA